MLIYPNTVRISFYTDKQLIYNHILFIIVCEKNRGVARVWKLAAVHDWLQ